MIDPFLRKGYRFKGRATIVAEGPLFETALAFYARQGLFDTPRRDQARACDHIGVFYLFFTFAPPGSVHN